MPRMVCRAVRYVWTSEYGRTSEMAAQIQPLANKDAGDRTNRKSTREITYIIHYPHVLLEITTYKTHITQCTGEVTAIIERSQLVL